MANSDARPIKAQWFGLDRLYVSDEPESLFAYSASLGPSLELAPRAKWTAFAAGRFGDAPGAEGIRFAVGDEEPKRIVGPLQAVLRAGLRGADFSEVRDLDPSGDHWLGRVLLGQVRTLRIEGPVPLMDPRSSSGAGLWCSRFLSSIAQLNSKTAGVVVVLRPFWLRDTSREHDPIRSLRSHFATIPVVRTQTAQSDEDQSGKTVTTSMDSTVEQQRQRALGFLDEATRGGLWWATVLAFGDSDEARRRVASLYWSAICGTEGAPGGHATTYSGDSLSARELQKGGLWAPLMSAKLIGARYRDGKQKAGFRGLRAALLAHDVRPMFHRAEPDAPLDTRLRRAVDAVLIPAPWEGLLTGRRLSTLLQLPLDSNPLTPVVRGFGYCFVAPKPTSPPLLTIGSSVGSGGEVQIPVEDLTRHTLVVGSTGAGKTTTVLAMLAGLRDLPVSKRPLVAILEGAKREYRSYRKLLGIDARGHYDLLRTDSSLCLNVFQHPPDISPEAHISQITAIFEATLDMPTPLPSIMGAAVSHAYSEYHAEPVASPLRQMHPIRYWLLRSVFLVLGESDYKGDVEGNIKGALRTRIRGLSQGAAGRVLSGRGKWKDISRRLTEQPILMELESIADRHSRSLVMSLFVLYYRYALGGPSRELRNLLVLEEAHRIIGKDPTGAGDASLEYFGNLLSEIRARGCGVLISDQSPARLIDDAMRNTNTKVLMRLVSGEDIQAAVVGSGLDPGAMRDIPRLSQFEAILTSSDRVPQHIRIQLGDHLRPTSVEEVEHLELDRLRAELAAEERLSRLHLRVLGLLTLGAPPGKMLSKKVPRAFELSDADFADLWSAARLELGCACEAQSCSHYPELLCRALCTRTGVLVAPLAEERGQPLDGRVG